ncbi:MAG TPA: polyhydroxyalkanoic acid system family protein [Paucimonas sp.]|nr:polyhydroxyalkanoic acid system family protein [Paucimonas sp.]HJW56228.1 polyhydroxyalkanoic acid system family protein [Burkholderiaceae bacterium]
MADIRITQKHKLSHKKAKAAAQKIADKMAEKFDMSTEWEGDVLVFKRSGVSGMLAVYETEARLEISLGLLFKAFSEKIEDEVTRNMKKAFSPKS